MNVLQCNTSHKIIIPSVLYFIATFYVYSSPATLAILFVVQLVSAVIALFLIVFWVLVQMLLAPC